MKKLTRIALAAGSAGAALAFVGSALAAYTPRIDVSVPNGLGATGTTRVHIAVGPTDDTTARFVSYSPVGFTVNPGTPGQTIGDVDARVRAGDLGGAIVPVTGTIEVRAADGTALVSGVPVPLAALATGCTGTATHTAFWILKLSAAGQSLELATFFDTTTGAETALGPSKLTFCLPPDDVPAGTPGRSPLGIKLVDALLVYRNVYTNPTTPNVYTWLSFWTPYNPGVGTANAAGTVTAIGVNALPVTATLKGAYVKKTRSARLVGRVTLAGTFASGLRLPLFSGPLRTKLKRSGSTSPTRSNGSFTALKRIIKTTFFQVRLAIPAVDFTTDGCAVVPATLPRCVSAWIGPFSFTTPIVKVTPRR